MFYKSTQEEKTEDQIKGSVWFISRSDRLSVWCLVRKWKSAVKHFECNISDSSQVLHPTKDMLYKDIDGKGWTER